jgi:VIT1/CCC1 family predicted Fe2+/Mn2+ transporter
VAWGLVDAVMYVMNSVLGRGRKLLLDRALREGADPAELRSVLAEVLPEHVAAGLSTADLESVRRAVATHRDLHPPARVLGEDLLAALGVFLVVVASTFPVALPFLLIHDVALAKTVSRGLSLALLFAGGYGVGRYSGVRPVWMGLAMLAIGAALVAAVTALGG